jgi:hypothetical protein
VAAQTVLRGANSVDFTISDQKPSCTPDPIQLTCTADNPATCALAQTTIQPEGSTTLTVGNLQAVGAAPVHVEVVKTSGFRSAAVDVSVYVADFAISEYPAATTVSAGKTASYSMTLSPVNGLKGNLQFSCQGAPEGASCSISPNAVTLDGTSPVQATVTVSTTARSLGAPRVPPASPPSPSTNRWMWLLGHVPFGAWLGLALLVSLIVASRRRRPALVLAGLLLTALVWAACGGGGMTSNSTPGTPAGTYNLTVTTTYSTSGGQTGELSHVTKLTLTVN